MKRRQFQADLLLLLVTLVWGATFVMVKDAVAAYPVFPFLALRFGLAALPLLLLGWRRTLALGWRGVAAGVLIGLFLSAGYAFQTLGLQSTSASKASFITGLSVVIVPILSTVLLRRLPTFSAVIGVCLATIGLALLTLGNDLRINTGDLLVLGCALSFGLHIVSVSAFAPHMDTLGLSTVQVTTVAIICTAISLFSGEGLPAPTGSVWFAAAFTGVLATALAFSIQTAMQRFTTPTHTALIFAAEPVFGALFGFLLAGEMLAGRGIAGALLILSGTVIGEMRWSERTATIISRFLAPQYVVTPLVLVLGLLDPVSWQRGLLWALFSCLWAVVLPLLILRRELRRGGISDWHISVRQERLRPIPLLASIASPAVPLAAMLIFRGPQLLLVGFITASLLIVFTLLVTVQWKISGHVTSVAATTTLIAATIGPGAAPLLLLIPLVAWARVKIGAHTVMQTVAGGLGGVGITLLSLRFAGLV
ncbi:MAG: DMT family transporter [Anaerolineae bacterium]